MFQDPCESSIQQSIIEKLWIAILSRDPAVTYPGDNDSIESSSSESSNNSTSSSSEGSSSGDELNVYGQKNLQIKSTDIISSNIKENMKSDLKVTEDNIHQILCVNRDNLFTLPSQYQLNNEPNSDSDHGSEESESNCVMTESCLSDDKGMNLSDNIIINEEIALIFGQTNEQHSINKFQNTSDELLFPIDCKEEGSCYEAVNNEIINFSDRYIYMEEIGESSTDHVQAKASHDIHCIQTLNEFEEQPCSIQNSEENNPLSTCTEVDSSNNTEKQTSDLKLILTGIPVKYKNNSPCSYESFNDLKDVNIELETKTPETSIAHNLAQSIHQNPVVERADQRQLNSTYIFPNYNETSHSSNPHLSPTKSCLKKTPTVDLENTRKVKISDSVEVFTYMYLEQPEKKVENSSHVFQTYSINCPNSDVSSLEDKSDADKQDKLVIDKENDNYIEKTPTIEPRENLNQEKETNYYNENSNKDTFGDSQIELCLKEAVIEVLQSLPEGWVLEPDHTAELFQSLLSVIESFPRKYSTLQKVIKAILDVHERRPCLKGEIPALNNEHLLLYIGLKLCCVWSLRSQHYNDSYEEDTVEGSHYVNEDMSKIDEKKYVQILLASIKLCEKSLDRLMMCLLLGSRSPGRGCGWYCESEEELEKVFDLRYILSQARLLDECSMSTGFVTPMLRLLHAPGSVDSLVGKPMWSCGSCPLVVAALAERPGLLLTLLQHGAGITESSRPDRCYRDGTYLAIAYLVKTLAMRFTEDISNDNEFLLTLGDTPAHMCLKHLLRTVPTVSPRFLRDHVREVAHKDPATLLPVTNCLQPPMLKHYSKICIRYQLSVCGSLPNGVEDLNLPLTLKNYLYLLSD